MVKAVASKPSRAYKVAKPSTPITNGASVSLAGSSVDVVISSPPIDSDEEEFADCSAVGVDSKSFDLRVDRCFIISDVGSVRQVAVASVQKDVFNVMLITPLGELILLSAWQRIALNLYQFF